MVLLLSAELPESSEHRAVHASVCDKIMRLQGGGTARRFQHLPPGCKLPRPIDRPLSNLRMRGKPVSENENTQPDSATPSYPIAG